MNDTDRFRFHCEILVYYIQPIVCTFKRPQHFRSIIRNTNYRKCGTDLNWQLTINNMQVGNQTAVSFIYKTSTTPSVINGNNLHRTQIKMGKINVCPDSFSIKVRDIHN